MGTEDATQARTVRLAKRIVAVMSDSPVKTANVFRQALAETASATPRKVRTARPVLRIVLVLRGSLVCWAAALGALRVATELATLPQAKTARPAQRIVDAQRARSVNSGRVAPQQAAETVCAIRRVKTAPLAPAIASVRQDNNVKTVNVLR